MPPIYVYVFQIFWNVLDVLFFDHSAAPERRLRTDDCGEIGGLLIDNLVWTGCECKRDWFEISSFI